MDVQDLPPLNALSLELATVLDEISGVFYYRATKDNEWMKKKHALSGHYSREPCLESPSSLYASEGIEVSDVAVDPVSLDRISGFNIFSPTLFPDRNMDIDEGGSLGYSFDSTGSLFSTDMKYVDKVGGFDHVLHSEAVEHALPMDSSRNLAGFYQILHETQDQLSGRIALKKVSQFVDHVAPMLSNKDVSALQSILERLNVKSEEHIIHLKHPDVFVDERDDSNAEIIWITSEASSETDEFKAVDTASFVSDTFSISEFVPKESSNVIDESEIIWITASEEELADIDQSHKTGTACTAAQRTDYDYDFHTETPGVILKSPERSLDHDESEFIWLTSPEEDLTQVKEEPSTSKLLQTSYEDQSKSYKTIDKKVSPLPATKASCKLYDFAGEEVIITPFIKRITGSDDLPCWAEEAEECTTVNSVKTSDKSSSSSKQQDASSYSSPETVCKLPDFAGEEVIVTPLVKPVDVSSSEKRKNIMQPCLAHDSELSIGNLDKSVKNNEEKIGHKVQLDLKNSMKEVVPYLDHSADIHEKCIKSPVSYELVPHKNVLQNPSFENKLSDSSTDDMKFNILNLEKSSGIYIIHDNSNKMHLTNSDHAADESQYLSDQQLTQTDSTNASVQDSTNLENSLESGLPSVIQYRLLKEYDQQETTSSSDGENEVFIKNNSFDHTLVHVGKYSTCQQNMNFDDSEIRSGLQENEKTIKDSAACSENLSSLKLSECKDFPKPEDPVATKLVQNFHHSGRTPTVLENNTRDSSDQASLHNQQNHSADSVSKLCHKFTQMPSEDVFPTSSLLGLSYGSNEVEHESSSTDELKKKKSARYWMRKIFIPKKFHKKKVKGIR